MRVLDSGPVSKALGVFAVVAGCLLVGAGALYAEAGWSFGGAIFWWTVMWGAMFAGLGLILATSRSVVGPGLGAALCGLSALLIVLWQRDVGDLGWEWICGVPAAGGLVIGVVVSLRNLRNGLGH
jgi:hypothetical protein